MSLGISFHNDYSILFSFIIIHYDIYFRDNDRHQENVRMLRESLKPHLKKHLDEKNKFTFWCEACLGRFVWRANEADLHRKIELRDDIVCDHREKEFYTR